LLSLRNVILQLQTRLAVKEKGARSCEVRQDILEECLNSYTMNNRERSEERKLRDAF